MELGQKMCVSEIYRSRPVKNRNMEGRGVEEIVQGQKGAQQGAERYQQQHL